MVRASLILLTLLAGCQSVQERAEKAADAKGRAQASTPFPDLPGACTAKMERVKPKPSEPRVITLKRWDVVADNRDRQSADCAQWGVDMKQSAAR
ncbi:hypothetical protein [Neorhizobium galegae]|uniref:hypothetical protein n=1 Tax=Neorhizobium galegae TaxID=399 RepID=UPI001F44575A|nr:hypothetical protein [Neorhizobium galegae]UIK04921.1 hypothetical protein LZK81_20050 [Neorhizobium galegae]